MFLSLSRLAGLTLAASLSLVALPLAAHDYTQGDLKIEHPWARATPAGAKVAGGFMTITNTGKETDRLVAASAGVAGHMEVHEMRMEGDVMRMRELADGLPIEPGKSVKLAPGGYHIMFMELKEPLKQGAKVPVTLTFAKAGSLTVEMQVDAMGARDSGHGHQHPPAKP